MSSNLPRRLFLRTGSLLMAAGSLFGANAATAADAAPASRPILLELFTSQGCSSCPAADAVLRDLGGRGDVLALGFHVDYWDYLGWADPFASPQFTARQQVYSQRRGFQMYTPQLVIDGQAAVVGSQRGRVEGGIETVKRELRAVASAIVRNGASVKVSVGTTAQKDAGGEVYLVSFDPEEATDIQRGENSGRRIVYTNVVRSIRAIGRWDNQPMTVNETLRGDERGARLALIVQNRNGEIWAVAATPAG